MDQFRGYTVAGMVLVNFIGDFGVTHPVFKHHNTYFSYADTILPSFLFAAGFSYRLIVARRLGPGRLLVTDWAAIPWGDPGIGGAVGGDSAGGNGGGGSGAIPGVGGGSFGTQASNSGTPGVALDPLGNRIPSEVKGLTAELAGIWADIQGGAPIVGVYLLLAALILIGVLALLLSSPAGQAAVRGTEAELTGGASEAGRAVGRVITRRKKKQPAKS